jgi:hypothetical protein
MRIDQIRSWRTLVVSALAVALAGSTTPGASAGPATQPDPAPRATHAVPRLPVTFARNDGQAASAIRYLGATPGVSVAFTDGGVTLNLDRTSAPKAAATAITLRFIGANTHPIITGADRTGEIVNDFHGADSTQWHTNIPSYNQVVYHNLWPGIDAKFSTKNGTLKYAFDVARDADPDNIRLSYTGADHLSLDRGGDLTITAGQAVLHDQSPVSYQNTRGVKEQIATHYRLLDATTFGFTLPSHAPGPITIDPGLDYGTYVNGTDGETTAGFSVDHDAAGNIYLFGNATTSALPTTPGAFQAAKHGINDFIIAKLDPTGSHLIYATYIGGSDIEGAFYGEVADDGSIYATGESFSPDFPTSADAYRRTPYIGDHQSVAVKLNPTGSELKYGTYLAPDLVPNTIGIGNDGSATIGGAITSDYAPTTTGAFQTAYPGGRQSGYLIRLNATGSDLVFATYMGVPVTDQGGGSGVTDLAVDSSGATYVAGGGARGFPITRGTQPTGTSQPAIIKLDPSGKKLDYATYFGNAPGNRVFGPGLVAVDKAGNAYVTAETPQGGVQTTPGAYQPQCAIKNCTAVIKYDPTGSVAYSTYFGGTSGSFIAPEDFAIDSEGRMYVVGLTSPGNNLPVTPDAFATTPGDFAVPWFVSVLGKGTLLYSSYFGGTGSLTEGALTFSIGAPHIAPDVSSGTLYLGGTTGAHDFPTTPGAFQPTYPGGFDSAWAAKLTLPDLPDGDTTSGNANASPHLNGGHPIP